MQFQSVTLTTDVLDQGNVCIVAPLNLMVHHESERATYLLRFDRRVLGRKMAQEQHRGSSGPIFTDDDDESGLVGLQQELLAAREQLEAEALRRSQIEIMNQQLELEKRALEESKRILEAELASARRGSVVDLDSTLSESSSEDGPSVLFPVDYEKIASMWSDAMVNSYTGAAEDGWKLVSEANDIVVKQRRFGHTRVPCIRAAASVNGSNSAVQNAIKTAAAVDLGAGVISSDVVETVVSRDGQMTVLHVKCRSPLYFVRNRDFCVLQVRRSTADGSVVSFCRSIEHPTCLPDPDGHYVRGHVHLCGYVVTPVQGRIVRCNKPFLRNAQTWQVAYVQQIDARMFLPTWLRTILCDGIPATILADPARFLSSCQPVFSGTAVSGQAAYRTACGPDRIAAPHASRIPQPPSHPN